MKLLSRRQTDGRRLVRGLALLLALAASVAAVGLVTRTDGDGETATSAARPAAPAQPVSDAPVSAKAPERNTRPTTVEAAGRTPATSTRHVPTAASARTVRVQRAAPVDLAIPAIGVHAAIVPLGLNGDQTMQVPAKLADAGWFRPGPEPGEVGAAVVVGHVAARSGRGVFWRLRELHRGDVVTLRLSDRSVVRFVVRSKLRVSKAHFPTDRVYARTAAPTLRLITCAGRLDPVTGHHPENLIVFATLAS